MSPIVAKDVITTEAKLQLIIRCAMQSFSDYSIECPADWSVLQLKEHLSHVCSSKPEPSRQRLIYAGRCLENGQKIGDVLMQRREGVMRNEVADKQVVHMVYIGLKTSPTSSQSNGTSATASPSAAAIGEGLRRRVSAAVPSAVHNQTPSNLFAHQLHQQVQQQYQFNGFPSTINFGQQQTYEAWMTAYQNYMGQMMQFYQQMPYPDAHQLSGQYQVGYQPQFYDIAGTAARVHVLAQQQGVHQPLLFNGQQMVMPEAAQQQPNGVFDNGPAGVGGRMVAAAEMGAVNAMPDFLDLVYKSIRFALLVIVLYLYSSLERFFFVLAIVALFWFVHRRRGQDRNGGVPAQDGPAQQNVEGRNPAGEQPQDQQGRDAPLPQNAEGRDVSVAQQSSAPSPPSSSPWNVFITVVQSFFTSLVPNPAPAPLDIN